MNTQFQFPQWESLQQLASVPFAMFRFSAVADPGPSGSNLGTLMGQRPGAFSPTPDSFSSLSSFTSDDDFESFASSRGSWHRLENKESFYTTVAGDTGSRPATKNGENVEPVPSTSAVRFGSNVVIPIATVGKNDQHPKSDKEVQAQMLSRTSRTTSASSDTTVRFPVPEPPQHMQFIAPRDEPATHTFRVPSQTEAPKSSPADFQSITISAPPSSIVHISVLPSSSGFPLPQLPFTTSSSNGAKPYVFGARESDSPTDITPAFPKTPKEVGEDLSSQSPTKQKGKEISSFVPVTSAIPMPSPQPSIPSPKDTPHSRDYAYETQRPETRPGNHQRGRESTPAPVPIPASPPPSSSRHTRQASVLKVHNIPDDRPAVKPPIPIPVPTPPPSSFLSKRIPRTGSRSPVRKPAPAVTEESAPVTQPSSSTPVQKSGGKQNSQVNSKSQSRKTTVTSPPTDNGLPVVPAAQSSTNTNPGSPLTTYWQLTELVENGDIEDVTRNINLGSSHVKTNEDSRADVDQASSSSSSPPSSWRRRGVAMELPNPHAPERELTQSMVEDHDETSEEDDEEAPAEEAPGHHLFAHLKMAGGEFIRQYKPRLFRIKTPKFSVHSFKLGRPRRNSHGSNHSQESPYSRLRLILRGEGNWRRLRRRRPHSTSSRTTSAALTVLTQS